MKFGKPFPLVYMHTHHYSFNTRRSPTEILDKFQSFGVGNPEPQYVARDLTVRSAEPVGTDGKHMRLNVTHKSAVVRKTIGFNCGKWCAELKPGDRIDLVFEVGINEWNGTRELQLKIVDLKKL